MKILSTCTLLILLLNVNYLFAQTEATMIREKIDNATESQLIEYIKGNQLELKNEAARKIRLLIANDSYEVKPGNIYEHKVEYWKNKVDKMPAKLRKEDFLHRYEIHRSDFKPKHKKIKYYQLDHFFLLRTEIKAKKVVVTNLLLNPDYFDTEPVEKFSGTWRDYFVNGQLKSETQYTNGIKNGIQKIYDANGKLSWQNTIEYGNTVKCDAYYPNGNLRRSYTENWVQDENWGKF